MFSTEDFINMARQTRTLPRSSRRKTTICANALRYCASKDEKYYGFHGHLVISIEGVITGFSLTAANVSEREALWDVVDGIKGLLIGDKGYLGASLQRDLNQYQLNLQTPKRSKMMEERPKHLVRALVQARRLIETSSGELRRASHGGVPKALIGQL